MGMTDRGHGPELLRVSTGTASVLGLDRIALSAKPTTAYLMLYHPGRCLANCAFCPQARTSRANPDLLSRITWPPYRLADVLTALSRAGEKGLRRICIQALLYPGFLKDLETVIRAISFSCDLPISVSTQPISEKGLRALREAGSERISIPVDAATPALFDSVKGRSCGGPYRWEGHMRALRKALKVFGDGMVGTHLIIGLGETEREAVRFIQAMYDMGIYVGLFAFTPIRGTKLEDWPRPELASYRRVQLARYLISEGLARYEQMDFDEQGRIRDFGLRREDLIEVVSTGLPFMTSGCPGCNRPYYNEPARGPLYNYPFRPREEDIRAILAQLGLA